MSTTIAFYCAPLFLSLFSAWMLWGWCVGESRNLRWMRLWFAPPFVISAMILAFGAGALMSRIATKRAVRSDVRAAFTSIEESIAAGRTNDVLDEIRRTNMSGNPDASDFDLLRHLPAMTQKLAKKPRVEVARGGQASPVR